MSTRGYRDHDAPKSHRVFPSGQKHGVFGTIKRELRRRSVIGPTKSEGYRDRCYLKGPKGNAPNAILTAVGYNLRLILAWLRMLLHLILTALGHPLFTPSALKSAY